MHPSFRSICETGREPAGWKQAAYYRYWMHMAHHDNPGEMAIRTKTHKLIYFYGCDSTDKARGFFTNAAGRLFPARSF